jgi:hypothetical protein
MFSTGAKLDRTVDYLYTAYDEAGNWTKRSQQINDKDGTLLQETMQERNYIYYK